jgi:hypothetical protein
MTVTKNKTCLVSTCVPEGKKLKFFSKNLCLHEPNTKFSLKNIEKNIFY